MRDFRFVVIGAGVSGLLWGHALRAAGWRDVTLYERAETLGGTWRDNTYPGLCCDVPSHLYRYSFAPNAEWSQRFSPGAEIRQYLEGFATERGLHDSIRFGVGVTDLCWHDRRWQITLSDGTRDSADFVVLATGVLVQPQYPDLPGLETFAGAAFHSARWNHDVPLDGRRVGVIGTGSTAVQIVSGIVDRVARLTLFQRTAQWIFPQPNPRYSDEERARFRDDPEIMQEMHARYAQSFVENFSNAVIDRDSPRMALVESICRDHLERSVADPELRAALTPDYRAACKRLIMSADFYQSIQRRNAELVTAAIDRVEPLGVRTRDGVLHELDVLVLATGFKPHEFMRPMTIQGLNGRTLDDYWANGAKAYRSVAMPGFPNLFMMVGPNSPIGNFSIIQVAEAQQAYIMQLIEAVVAGRAAALAPTDAATDRFNAALAEAMAGTIWVTGCRSWYLDRNGKPATWPWSFDRFAAELAAPDLRDFEFVA